MTFEDLKELRSAELRFISNLLQRPETFLLVITACNEKLLILHSNRARFRFPCSVL